jgi:hypothetical protein
MWSTLAVDASTSATAYPNSTPLWPREAQAQEAPRPAQTRTTKAQRMRLPWVSRAKYDAVVAELEAERKRARRRQRRRTAKDSADLLGHLVEKPNTTTTTVMGWTPIVENT